MLLIVACCLLFVVCGLGCAVHCSLLKFRLSLRVVRCLPFGACFFLLCWCLLCVDCY